MIIWVGRVFHWMVNTECYWTNSLSFQQAMVVCFLNNLACPGKWSGYLCPKKNSELGSETMWCSHSQIVYLIIKPLHGHWFYVLKKKKKKKKIATNFPLFLLRLQFFRTRSIQIGIHISPFWCWGWNFQELGQYHGCWCPGSFHPQDISRHGIDDKG